MAVLQSALFLNLKNLMKIDLFKHEGNAVGWQIVAENKEDQLRLGSIRNLQFFGLGDTAIEYAGRQSKDDRYVDSLAWKQEQFIAHTSDDVIPELEIKEGPKSYSIEEVRHLVRKAWLAGGKDSTNGTYEGPDRFVTEHQLD